MPIQKTWRKTQITRATYNCVALYDAVGIIITFHDFNMLVGHIVRMPQTSQGWSNITKNALVHREYLYKNNPENDISLKSFIKLKYWTARQRVQIKAVFYLWIFALQILHCQVLHHRWRPCSNNNWTLNYHFELVRHTRNRSICSWSPLSMRKHFPSVASNSYDTYTYIGYWVFHSSKSKKPLGHWTEHCFKCWLEKHSTKGSNEADHDLKTIFY